MEELTRTVMAFMKHKNDFLFIFHKGHEKWMGPGGKVKPGEMLHEAVEREVLEEVGIKLQLPYSRIDERCSFLPAPYNVLLYVDKNGDMEEDYTYVINVDDETRYQPVNSPEGLQAMWVDLDYALDSLELYVDTKIQLEMIKSDPDYNPVLE